MHAELGHVAAGLALATRTCVCVSVCASDYTVYPLRSESTPNWILSAFESALALYTNGKHRPEASHRIRTGCMRHTIHAHARRTHTVARRCAAIWIKCGWYVRCSRARVCWCAIRYMLPVPVCVAASRSVACARILDARAPDSGQNQSVRTQPLNQSVRSRRANVMDSFRALRHTKQSHPS